uniref:Ig-like domain-containing protein n=1 Tax=Anabas testudineus TaxID=64144 RepID=A0AAQ6ISD6_ANATE
MFSQQQDNMEVTALCIKLLSLMMMLLCEHDQKVNAASLHIDPNRAQFFEYESLTFYCEGISYCEVVHESKGKISSCNKTNNITLTGSSCILRNVYTDESGEYWFDAGGGNKSNSVNITITDGSVILEIPALPVMVGEAVTLRCRNKTTSSETLAEFYKDGVFIGNSATVNSIIRSVSKSDEGLYKCSISGVGESAESRLTVGESHQSLPDITSPSTPWIIATVFLVILLVVVVLYHFGKDDWNKVVFFMSTLRSRLGLTGNQTVSESVDSAATSTPATYAVVIKKRRGQDEDQSSCKPLYHMLDLDATHQLEPVIPATTNSPLTADAYYSTIQ